MWEREGLTQVLLSQKIWAGTRSSRRAEVGTRHVPECSSPLFFPTAQQDVIAAKARVTWCAVGSEEKRKCDQWNRASSGRVTCTSFRTTEDCIIAIMVLVTA